MIKHNEKIDLACGDMKTRGFFGIDLYKTASTDAVMDLLSFPWPIADSSVEEVICSHFFEHVPKEMRPMFMENLYRILKLGGKATIITPTFDRAFQDFTHEWPPIVWGSYLYFNRKWREDIKLLHGPYDIKCDFDFEYGYSLRPDLLDKDADFKRFAVDNYNNSTIDLIVTLYKRR